jgi:hypothetical protein
MQGGQTMATIRPTLILGIGTTGLKILEELEKLWIITFSQPMPSIFQLVAIDTEEKSAQRTSLGNSQIQVINIGVNTALAKTTLGQNLGRDPFWLRDVEEKIIRRVTPVNPNIQRLEHVRNVSIGGAWNIRSLGRLSLWGSWVNFTNLLNVALGQMKLATPQVFQEAAAFFGAYGDNVVPQSVAYVVGSTGGGTGSGIVIDIGHHLIGKVNNRFGIFLLPVNDPQVLDMTILAGRAKPANTYATLEEMRFYFDQNTCGNAEDPVWSDNNARNSGIPYDLVYLVGSLQIGMRFKEMWRIIAFRLFLGMLGLTDHLINGGLGGAGLGALTKSRWITTGLTAFYRPKREIEESSASILGAQLVNELTKTVNPGDVKQEKDEWISKVLEEVVIQLSGADNPPEVQIAAQIQSLRGGEKSWKDFEDGEKPKFKEKGSYYVTIEGNLEEASNNLNNRFDGNLRELTNQKQSLRWAEEAARALAEGTEQIHCVADEVLEYWDKIRVPKNDDELNTKVEDTFKELRNISGVFGPRPLGEYYEVIFERLNGLLTQVKEFKLRGTLANLKAYVGEHYRKIQELRQSLETVVKDKLLSDPSSLKAHIQVGATMWHPVYGTGSLEDDVKATIGTILQKDAVIRQIPLDFGNVEKFLGQVSKIEDLSRRWIPGNLWDTLHPHPSDSSRQDPTEEEIALSIREQLSSHNNISAKAPRVNVSNAANQNRAQAIALANSAEGGLLDRDPNVIPTPVIRGILASDMANLGGIIDATNLRPLVIHALEDFVAFCVEQGDISINWLNDLNVWRNWYQNAEVRKTFLLHTFDLEGYAKLGEVRDRVQMALHLLIEYTPTGIPQLPCSPALFNVQPGGRVLFQQLNLTVQAADVINGGDSLEMVVERLADNPNLYTQFRQTLIAALKTPHNSGAELQKRLNNLENTNVIDAQKATSLRMKYFGDGVQSGLVARV